MSTDPRATPRRSVFITAVFGALFIGRALLAWAEEPDRHGYWRQEGVGAVGAPAVDVPSGGLLVSKGLANEVGVSALAVRVGNAPVSEVVLVATEAAAAGGVIACRATSTWSQPDGAGAWTDRPTHDCESGAVAGTNDEGTWRFDVGDLVANGVLDVVFVPDESVAPFSIAFEAPTAATVEVDRGSAPTTSTTTPSSPAGSTSGADVPPVTVAPAPSSGFSPPSPTLESSIAPVDSPLAGPEVVSEGAAPTELGSPVADLDDRATAATGPSGIALASVFATALSAAAVWIWRRATATAELAAGHRLAGPPSLAGDSVRFAGRALVDADAEDADPMTAAGAGTMEMA